MECLAELTPALDCPAESFDYYVKKPRDSPSDTGLEVHRLFLGTTSNVLLNTDQKLKASENSASPSDYHFSSARHASTTSRRTSPDKEKATPPEQDMSSSFKSCTPRAKEFISVSNHSQFRDRSAMLKVRSRVMSDYVSKSESRRAGLELLKPAQTPSSPKPPCDTRGPQFQDWDPKSDSSKFPYIVEPDESGALIQVIPKTTPKTTYPCCFYFLRCDHSFDSIEDWETHCLSHFRGHSPPKTVQCPYCDWFGIRTFNNASEAWQTRIRHIVYHHDQEGLTIREARPDFRLFRHLWNKKIINGDQLQSLMRYPHSLESSRRR